MPKTSRSKKLSEDIPISTPPAEQTAPAEVEPSPEAIAKRAYEIYLARGGAHGNDTDDWLQAELDLRANQK